MRGSRLMEPGSLAEIAVRSSIVSRTQAAKVAGQFRILTSRQTIDCSRSSSLLSSKYFCFKYFRWSIREVSFDHFSWGINVVRGY